MAKRKKIKFPTAQETPSAAVVEEAVRAMLNRTAATRKREEAHAPIIEYAETYFKKNKSADALFIHSVQYKKSGKKVVVAELPRGTVTDRSRNVAQNAVRSICSIKLKRVRVKRSVTPAHEQIRAFAYMHPEFADDAIDIDTDVLPRGATFSIQGSALVDEILDDVPVS